jgi:hypothetical protein
MPGRAFGCTCWLGGASLTKNPTGNQHTAKQEQRAAYWKEAIGKPRRQKNVCDSPISGSEPLCHAGERALPTGRGKNQAFNNDCCDADPCPRCNST